MSKQQENQVDEQFNDFKHHISTMKTTQLNSDEFNLLCTRLTYQLDRINTQVQATTIQTQKKITNQLQGKEPTLPTLQKSTIQLKPVHKSNLSIPKTLSQKSFISETKFHQVKTQQLVRDKFLEPKISQQQSKSLTSIKRKVITAGKIKQPTLLPRALRKDPFSDPPPITDKDLQRGVYTLMQGGIIPPDVDISAAFKRGGELVTVSGMRVFQLDPRQLKFLRVFQPQETREKYRLDIQHEDKQNEIIFPQQLNGIDIDPGLFLTNTGGEKTSRSYKQRGVQKKQQESVQQLMLRQKVYHLEIVNGRVNENSELFKYYKIDHLPYWGGINHIFKRLEEIASNFKLSKTKIDGLRVVNLADGYSGPTMQDYLKCFCNQSIVQESYKLYKRQYFQKKGYLKALIKIQCGIRMFLEERRYKRVQTRIQKVVRIQHEFKLQQMYKNTILQIKQKMGKVESLQQDRQNVFKNNWPILSRQERIEVHIPSFSIDQFQRLTMGHFRHRESLGLSRLIALKDPNVEIIYITPIEPNEEVIQYFWKVLEVSGVKDGPSRVHFIFPENSNKFPYSCSLSKLLYFSPKALFQIKQIIFGKVAYLVPMRAGKEDFLIADYLEISIFSPPINILEQISKKSLSKKFFSELNLPVAPGCTDIKTKDDFIDKLSIIIGRHLFISKWKNRVFKIDSEFNGRGTASFTLEGIKQFTEIRKSAEIGEKEVKIIRELVAALLPLKTTFTFGSLYQNFDEYIEQFLKKGGIIEAYPFLQPKKQQNMDEQLGSVNIYFLIEPHGQISFLNTSDSIIINEFVAIGQVYPQTSLLNLNTESLMSKVGEELYKKGIWGYCKLSLLTFQDSKPGRLQFGLDEFVCAINLADCLGNNDTGFSVNNSMAEVANDLAGINYAGQKTFMYLPLLYHSGLANNKYKDLFAKCRKEGIQFDMEHKNGTLLLLCDDIDAGIISLMTLRETQRKSVKLMTDALNFLLHFAGNVVKMQNDNLKTDMFYFIDIVGRVRLLNKENEMIEEQKKN